MRTIATLLLALSLTTATAQVDRGRAFYLGAIGDTAVQMELAIDGEALSGWVQPEGLGLPFDLDGTVGRGEQGPTLRFDARSDGVAAGTFEGLLAMPDHQRITITGTWRGPGGEALPFELERVAEYSSLELSQGRIDARRSLPFFIDPALSALNPPLHDTALAELTEFFEAGREMLVIGEFYFGWSSDETTTIRYLGDGFLSAFSSIYSYTGGAHGNTNFRVYNLHFVDGSVRKLSLDELFDPGSGFLTPLSDYVLAELERQEASDVVSERLTELTLADLATFTLSPAGLTFAFAPYQVASYAEGPFFVTVPLELVAPYADAEGPLGRLLNGR